MSGTAVAPDDKAPVLGYYGKVPSRGDFLTRKLPRGFLNPWDAWLQGALSGSREQLGKTWLDCYLTSPLWRFALSPGVCGPGAALGVMMPSVDRVGRYFPLTLAALPGHCADPLALLEANGDWLQQAEALALEALDDRLNLEDFSRRVQDLGPPAAGGAGCLQGETGAPPWHLALNEQDTLDRVRSGLTHHLLRQHFPRHTLWWTSGSELIQPCLLVNSGLPEPGAFAAMLAGDWDGRGWSTLSIMAAAAGAPPAEESL